MITITEQFYRLLFSVNAFVRYGNTMLETKNIERTFAKIIRNEKYNVMLKEIEDHDSTTFHHSFDVFLLTALIQNYYGVSKHPYEFQKAALFHDVGKLLIRNELLQKTERLTSLEYEEIKLHTTYGAFILSEESNLSINLAKHHHEKSDGSGYPDNLFLNKLDIEIQWLSAIDVFSALTLDRPYRETSTPKEAFNIMEGMNLSEKVLYDLKRFLDAETLINLKK